MLKTPIEEIKERMKKQIDNIQTTDSLMFSIEFTKKPGNDDIEKGFFIQVDKDAVDDNNDN